ncbi:MAG: hypothetical protein HC842_07255, partial [Cytophagales bacterium]|nr:hypothetical protein [Cytophagales bacterium]
MKNHSTKYSLVLLALLAGLPGAQAQETLGGAQLAPLLWSLMALVALLAFVLLIIMLQLGVFFAKELRSKGHRLPWVLGLFLVFEGDTRIFTGEFRDEALDDHVDPSRRNNPTRPRSKRRWCSPRTRIGCR